MSRLWRGGVAIELIELEGIPQSFLWQEQTHSVERIIHSWRVDIEWWREHIWRDYFKLTTDTHLLIVIYRDLIDDIWYLQQLYD